MKTEYWKQKLTDGQVLRCTPRLEPLSTDKRIKSILFQKIPGLFSFSSLFLEHEEGQLDSGGVREISTPHSSHFPHLQSYISRTKWSTLSFR